MSTLFAAVCLRGNSGMHKAEIIRRRCLESLMRHVNKAEVLHYDSFHTISCCANAWIRLHSNKYFNKVCTASRPEQEVNMLVSISL